MGNAGWQHIYDDFPPEDEDLEEYLNFYGDQGFQLTAVVPINHGLHRFYFRRIKTLNYAYKTVTKKMKSSDKDYRGPIAHRNTQKRR